MVIEENILSPVIEQGFDPYSSKGRMKRGFEKRPTFEGQLLSTSVLESVYSVICCFQRDNQLFKC